MSGVGEKDVVSKLDWKADVAADATTGWVGVGSGVYSFDGSSVAVTCRFGLGRSG